MKSKFLDIFWYLIISFIAIVCVLCLNGCRTVKYVPIETVKTDSVVVVTENRDSIVFYQEKYDSLIRVTLLYCDTLIHDSVYVYEKEDGTKYNYKGHVEKIVITRIDSVYGKEKLESVKEKYQQTIDSLQQVKNEVIQVPIEVEKPEKWYNTWLRRMAILGIIAALIYISYILIRNRFFR